MGTNGTDIAAHLMLEEEKYGIERTDGSQERVEIAADSHFGPLVDKIALGIARALVRAVKDLEYHVANEARKAGEAAEHRLDSLQNSSQELFRFVGEQIATNGAVHDQLQQLTAGSAELREGQARHWAELETIRAEARDFSAAVYGRLDAAAAALQESEARQSGNLAAFGDETRASYQSIAERIDNLCRDLGVQQDDVSITKTTVCTISSRVDAFVERLDRQADAIRSLHTASAHRENELEQIVDGLTRLRAHPMPQPPNEL